MTRILVTLCALQAHGETQTTIEAVWRTVTNGIKSFIIRKMIKDFVCHTVRTGPLPIGTTGIVRLIRSIVWLESMAVMRTTLVLPYVRNT
jgi:hypothetical protein